MKTCTTLLIAILVWFSGTANAVSQTGTYCSCPENEQITHRLTICYHGQDCQVDVTLCNAMYSPPSTTVTCSGVNAVDMYTTISKICPVDGGCLLACDFEVILTAVLCELNPLGGDFFNMKSSIPNCSVNQTYFCWVVATPRCLKRTIPGLCIESCDSNECCIKHYRYCKDPVLGTYTAYMFKDCTVGNQTCPQGDCDCGSACFEWDPLQCPTCN